MKKVLDQEQHGMREVILPFVYVLFLIACARDDSTPHPYTVVVTDGDSTRSVQVEIAATSSERQQGLMWRRALDPDWGMLFLFPGDNGGGFWMRNTYVPLDIAYIGADGTVQEIRAAQPLDQTVLTPAKPYRYVLEVNQGWFEEHGLGVGSTITLPDNLPQAQ